MKIIKIIILLISILIFTYLVKIFYENSQMLFKDDRICIVNANNKYFSFYQQKQMIKGVPCDISILKFEDINKIKFIIL